MLDDFLKDMEEAELVLVGLGEEFDSMQIFKHEEDYIRGKSFIESVEKQWLLPAYDEIYRRQYCEQELDNNEFKNMTMALEKLSELLQNKNYFVISTSFNDATSNVLWKENRIVMPCGGISRKQCMDGCSEGSVQAGNEDMQALAQWFQEISKAENEQEYIKSNTMPDLGKCPKCGKPLVFNNIYAENYDENGYMEQWQIYMKWLQGTINKKVLILELGVGMKFPTVIRWPFEKVAFFNQKAKFYRVNETLYQMTEELKEKGTSIQKNSVDWLLGLC